ncbi:hypothetical protein [Myroides sp. WP-1]|uniref:hypothetical protein n=1 Tax=Myroides sp. WP-1 TaxID=2759944 RepID=UPI0015FE75E3|nr:hypothetical protein [Myroides sp. WP-1]MBB1140935.1 hypothetical protein [Myroides sp. WP-1]
MKKGMILIFSVLALGACKNTTEKMPESSNKELQVGEQQIDNAPMIGGEKNDHGCLVAAGETWSELRQKCLKIFEEGTRLNPVHEDSSAVISAFVLFNDDQSKVELFLPEESSKALILDKKDAEVYGDATYSFNAKEGTLYVNGKKQYTK